MFFFFCVVGFIKFIFLLLNIFIFMFEEQMSHDSRRELYEIFRLNYTKLNIILKKDGAYNGEKCPKDEPTPTANSEQATTRPCGDRTNEPTNVTRTNLQRTSRMHDQFEANSMRTQRNSRQRTRVAVNKIHVACVWRPMNVCVLRSVRFV